MDRQETFNRYLNNLKLTLKRIGGNWDNDAIVCPLCFSILPREELNGVDSLITIEHVPPEALGGSPQTLTCKRCNNNHGSNLDGQLFKYIKSEDFLSSTSTSFHNVSVYTDEGLRVGAVQARKNGRTILFGEPKRSNPKHFQVFDRKIKEGEIEQVEIHLEKNTFDWSSAMVSHLRIAYLWGFKTFGYGFIFTNNNLDMIRQQINDPAQHFIPIPGVFEREFPDRALGINLLGYPTELHAFLVVYDLEAMNTKKRYGVLLPGPNPDGLNIYKWLAHQDEQPRDLRFLPIKMQDQSIFFDYPFESLRIWEQVDLNIFNKD